MNLLKKISLPFVSFSLIATNVYSNEGMVAKVLLMRGSVKETLTDGKVIDVKVEQEIPEGAILTTADKSFVKLIFIDKSQMNLGPSSQMTINSFPKKEAGIITLVKGQIRSQVTKDYMEIEDKNKSKLYIKTNTAAMGIRGTDFQVNFNPENQNTALITFEGKVAMSHIEKNMREEKFDQTKLEKVVSSDKAVMVTGGHISAVNLNVAERAMIPTKLAPSQIDALKSNENGMKENNDKSENKQFRNPIPPGTEGTSFSNSPAEVDKMVKKAGLSNESMNNVKDKIADANNSNSKSDPNGFFNNKTGEYKLPAGSIIDLKTVNLIPPPTNAVFDPNTKTYAVPDNFGKIDKMTGEYRAPEGLKLNSDGKFQMVDQDAFMKAQIKKPMAPTPAEEKKEMAPATSGPAGAVPNEQTMNEPKPDPNNPPPPAPTVGMAGDPMIDPNRNPASLGGAPVPMPGMIMPPNLNEIRPDMQTFANNFAPVILNNPPVMNDQMKTLVQDKINTINNTNQNNANLGNVPSATKLHIDFNVQ